MDEYSREGAEGDNGREKEKEEKVEMAAMMVFREYSIPGAECWAASGAGG